MTHSITLRMPDTLLKQVEQAFPAKTKTASLLKSLTKGLAYASMMEEKMKTDYQSLSSNDCSFVIDSGSLATETFSDDTTEYLFLLK